MLSTRHRPLLQQHALNFCLHDAPPKDHGDARPLLAVLVQHVRAEPLQLGRVPSDQRCGRVHDLHGQGAKICSIEGQSQGGHLMQHHAHGPNVAAERVRLLPADLRAQIKGRADCRLREGTRAVERLRDAEVAEAELALKGQEHVLGL